MKSDKYRVYIRIRLANGNPLTYIVAAKTFKGRLRYGKEQSERRVVLMPGNTKKHRRGNGEGSVYQRKDGTWAAVLTVALNKMVSQIESFYMERPGKK